MDNFLINLLAYIIPALITGAVAFLFFREFIENENNRRTFLIHKELQKESLPIRLQAYERMTLFLERIKPNTLVVRVKPFSDDKLDYENLLAQTIEQEFEHNLTQQIYVSTDCWNVIVASKNATIQLIRNISTNEPSISSDTLRERIASKMMEHVAPSTAGLDFINKEVQNLWS